MMDRQEAQRLIKRCEAKLKYYAPLRNKAIEQKDHWKANALGHKMSMFNKVKDDLQRELDK